MVEVSLCKFRGYGVGLKNSLLMSEKLPEFLVIGAGKSGTTSLHNYLSQHPEIFLSSVKETNFFALEGKSISSHPELKELFKHCPESITSLEEYTDLFKDSEGLLKGEVCPMYLYNEIAAANIHRYIPDVKLIAIFRQPAERLYSRFLHLARESRTPTEHFEDCLDKNTIWWERGDLINEGFYFKHLKKFYDLFPAHNIKIFLYEDLVRDSVSLFHSMFDFLGVDPEFQPDVSLKMNQSGYIKNQFLNKIIGPEGIVVKPIKAISPKLVETAKKKTWLRKGLIELRSKNLNRPSLDPEFKKKLTLEVYESDIRQLQELVGINLEHWIEFN